MKSHTEYLTFNIPARMDFVNITGQVAECVRKSSVQEGLCLVNTKQLWLLLAVGSPDTGRRPAKTQDRKANLAGGVRPRAVR